MFNEDVHIRREIKRLQRQAKKAPLLFARLSECYMQLGDYHRAEPLLLRGVEDYPDYLAGLLVLGELYLFKGLYRDAEETVRTGLQKQPDHLGLLQLMLRIKKGQEYAHDVEKIQATLKALDPLRVQEELTEPTTEPILETDEDRDAHETLARITSSPSSIWKINTQLRRKKEAPTERTEAAAETPVEASERSLQQELAEVMGLPPEASADIPSGEAPPPFQRKIATKTLGELYARQNNYREAIEIYEKLVENDPHNEIYCRRLEELKARQESLLASQKD